MFVADSATIATALSVATSSADRSTISGAAGPDLGMARDLAMGQDLEDVRGPSLGMTIAGTRAVSAAVARLRLRFRAQDQGLAADAATTDVATAVAAVVEAASEAGNHAAVQALRVQAWVARPDTAALLPARVAALPAQAKDKAKDKADAGEGAADLNKPY